MHSKPTGGFSNRLLEKIIESDSDGLRRRLEMVELTAGTVLFEPEDRVQHVFFPESALISVVSISQEGDTIEVSLIGHEGAVGLPAAFNGISAHRALVSISGRARRLNADILAREFRTNLAVQSSILTYTNALFIQVSQTGICNCFHPLQQRLCRWLLLARDAAASEVLTVTHDLLACMLGARRASVTSSLGLMQRANLIRTGRGRITVLGRHSGLVLRVLCSNPKQAAAVGLSRRRIRLETVRWRTDKRGRFGYCGVIAGDHMFKVGVVEDNDDNRTVLEYMLQDEFEVVPYPSGTEALRKLPLDRPDVLILDVWLEDEAACSAKRTKSNHAAIVTS